MNKKAVFLGHLSDLYGWGFFILGALFWIFIFMTVKENVEFDVSSIPYTADDLAMLSYIKSPVDNGIVLDKVFDAYKYGDNEQLILAINTSLNSVYGRAKPVCWKLWYYEADKKELIAEESCGETLDLFDKGLIIPLPYNQEEKNIKIRLTVPGYK